MGSYGSILPVTGTALIVAGATVTTPWIAAVGGLLILTGFLALRLVKPARSLPKR